MFGGRGLTIKDEEWKKLTRSVLGCLHQAGIVVKPQTVPEPQNIHPIPHLENKQGKLPMHRKEQYRDIILERVYELPKHFFFGCESVVDIEYYYENCIFRKSTVQYYSYNIVFKTKNV